MYWNPPMFLKGAAVAVLGGGPSLTPESVARVRASGLRVIGVNDAYRFGNAVDVCFFGDAAWYLGTEDKPGHMTALDNWHGTLVSCNPDVANYPRINALLQREDVGLWPTPCCKWYRNSGLSAIGLAVTLGASRIILLGFDGGAAGGRTHWHDEPINAPDERVFAEHVKSAYTLLSDIENYPGGKGVQLWNTAPDSAYPFLYAPLDTALGEPK